MLQIGRNQSGFQALQPRRARFGFAYPLLLTIALLIQIGCRSDGISPLAVRSDQGNYVGRYMGGGKHFGQARHRHEGIWARDYAGLDFFHIIELRWSHSQRHYQGGLDIY